MKSQFANSINAGSLPPTWEGEREKLLDFIKTLKVHTTLPTIPSEALNPCPFHSAQFFRGSKNSFVQLSFENRYGEYICEKRLITELEQNGPLYNATCAVNKVGGILFQEREREREREMKGRKGYSSLACCIIYSNYTEFLILLRNGSHGARWEPIKIIRWKAIRKWNKFRDGAPSISNQGYKMQRDSSRLLLATRTHSKTRGFLERLNDSMQTLQTMLGERYIDLTKNSPRGRRFAREGLLKFQHLNDTFVRKLEVCENFVSICCQSSDTPTYLYTSMYSKEFKFSWDDNFHLLHVYFEIPRENVRLSSRLKFLHLPYPAISDTAALLNSRETPALKFISARQGRWKIFASWKPIHLWCIETIFLFFFFRNSRRDDYRKLSASRISIAVRQRIRGIK